MKKLIDMADHGLLPDFLIRFGIRQLDKKRLQAEKPADGASRIRALERFIEKMQQSPIAVRTHKANEQHYEVPPAFFERVLGKHLKYSSGYWPEGVRDLDQAEKKMLELTSRRAELTNGIRILELGCGWGSLTLHMANAYPDSRIVAVSNSKPQARFIQAQMARQGLENIQIITADMNDFSLDQQFDRIVSIEMFEHMRNWPSLLDRISGWLKPDGKFFIHIFTHRRYAYTFDEEGDDNWMGRHFFSGGMMPSDDLLFHLQNQLTIEKHWRVNGRHYSRTAEAWLRKMDADRGGIMPIMRDVYGKPAADRWFQRWRIFFMACGELWGYRNGHEWMVSHYLLKQK